MSEDKSQNAQNAGNSLQPVIYGVLPNQLNDEINLGDLFSKLIDQWKLIAGITLGGTLLAVLLALILPNVYQPSVEMSLPLPGKVSSVVAINTLIGGVNNELPTSPQAMFARYYDLFRSDVVLEDYVYDMKYLEKLYPDSTNPSSVLFAKLLDGWDVAILEPSPEKIGGYIANPKKVKSSIVVGDEAIGVALLNGYMGHVNQKLIDDLQSDVRKIIDNKLALLSKQVVNLREKYRQQRVLTIDKMEKDNARKVAVFEEQITAYLKKAGANRITRVANAKESLAMAQSLGIVYPTTVDMLAQKGQKAGSVKTAITVVDTQASSLYLKGSKYLTTFIDTLEKRESDEKYLGGINDLREKIHLIKNDQVLAALKKRESDDPWIEGLAGKLTRISLLDTFDLDFTNIVAYSASDSAIITDVKIKPKRKLIVIIGFVLSVLISMFVVLIKSDIKSRGRV